MEERPPVEQPEVWARWALRLGASVRDYDAALTPDGSEWWVKCRVEI